MRNGDTMKLKLPDFQKSKLMSIYVFLIVVLVAEVLTLTQPRSDPLDAYIVSRQCDFITFADLSAAACDDGTNWTVSEYQP